MRVIGPIFAMTLIVQMFTLVPAGADGPLVTDDRNAEDLRNPGVRVEDHRNGGGESKPRRDRRYGGVVNTEDAPVGTLPPRPSLNSNSTLDEFVNYVCANQGTLFDQPTDVAACPDVVNPVAAPPAVNNRPQAEQYALDYVRRIGLDRPKPEISAKNGGICGVVHTLDLRMNVERIFRDATAPYGTLNLHAYAASTVDWGDGRKQTYYTSGGPFPNTAISHAWTDRGYYDIQVNTRWTVHWSMGPYNGVLAGIPSSAAINDFRVWEAQAFLINEG